MISLPLQRATAFSLCLVCLGCGSESTPPRLQGNHAPSVRSARIIPNPIVLNSAVRLEVQGEDNDQDPLSFRARWYANDQLLEGESATSLDPMRLTRGMRVRAEVVALDGQAESLPYRTESVTVGNTPPEVRSVVPEISVPKVGDLIRLRIEGVDADDDTITYTYRWWRNTALVADGAQAEMDTAGFSRGDTIVVEVTPHDSRGAGRPSMSEPVILGNSPPTITSIPPSQVEQGRYVYTVTAVDPDGDPVSFALESAPPGMTIDKETGRVEWQLSAGMQGSQKVRIVAEDSQTGQAFQEFQLSVPPAPTS